MIQAQAVAAMEALATEANIGTVNDAERTRKISPHAGLPEAMETLEEMSGDASRELSERSDRMIELARLRLATLSIPKPSEG